MKTNDYDSPRVRVIENFVDLETCKFIINYGNKTNLWSSGNPNPEKFANRQDYEVFANQWNDRSITVESLFGNNAHKEFLDVLIKIKDEIVKQVNDFFKIENTVSIEGWDVVRWYYPFFQMPHVDYVSLDFDREKDLPEGYDENHLSPETEKLYKTYNNQKHFASMLYLSDDFEGGELYFPLQNDFEIKPKTGMLALFSGDFNHIHGVRQIISGTRYVQSTFWSREITPLQKNLNILNANNDNENN